ncbi:hypothetical protein CC80DRAFT_488661 [Byssothecium circinans]|uniref:Uncharacterized protein n=1 Tax=Byssothecium circinans TaxID=147558 RepID=A0A6A5U8X2_9PLEO|nr:hypothetical protein CC80DRAFT_488661 [Byssothecium circinans]
MNNQLGTSHPKTRMQRIRGGERLQGSIKGRPGWQKHDDLAANKICNPPPCPAGYLTPEESLPKAASPTNADFIMAVHMVMCPRPKACPAARRVPSMHLSTTPLNTAAAAVAVAGAVLQSASTEQTTYTGKEKSGEMR